jgi:hypothetical protein
MWSAILRHYDNHHRPRVEQERAWFASSANIDEAIRRATLATDSRGKRFQHQRRIPRLALLRAHDALLNEAQAITNAHDFDELLALITPALRDIRRTGELYRYDTALRLSFYLNLLPTRVFLHAGTRTGACRLGFSPKREFLDPHELPQELLDRPAHEIEDILCIYKDQFN